VNSGGICTPHYSSSKYKTSCPGALPLLDSFKFVLCRLSQAEELSRMHLQNKGFPIRRKIPTDHDKIEFQQQKHKESIR
jgi:hypothetical protein